MPAVGPLSSSDDAGYCLGVCLCRCMHGWGLSHPEGSCCMVLLDVARLPLQMPLQTNAGCPSCVCQHQKLCLACLVGVTTLAPQLLPTHQVHGSAHSLSYKPCSCFYIKSDVVTIQLMFAKQ